MMDIDKKAFAVLSLIQSDFGQSGGDVQFLAIRDELQQAYNKGLSEGQEGSDMKAVIAYDCGYRAGLEFVVGRR